VYHSITIGTKNSWTDWHLIPTSRPIVSLPPINEKQVSIPGRNGVLDLTEYLTGSPTYSNRKGTWEFYIVLDSWQSWELALYKISAYCHGKSRNVVLEDEPGYQYTGKLKVAWRPQKDYSVVVIEYDLDPFKLNIETGEYVIF